MPSPLRYIPDEYKLWTDDQGRRYAIVEITVRCIQGRPLLVPTDSRTSVILGVLGRAQALLDFPLFGYAFLSNHGSYLAGVRNVEHQASIMEYVHGNTSRELGRKEYSDWPGKFWERRGRPILVASDDDLEERLRYLLANSTKENLVLRPTLWPGAHCARSLCQGVTDKGLWINRTEFSRRARRKTPRHDDATREPVETYYDVRLDRLPSHAPRSAEAYREFIKAMCTAISDEAEQERKATGCSVLGVNAILAQHPHERPEDLSRSPAPLVHCAGKKALKSFLDAYGAFVVAYRAAFAALRQGIVGFAFPHGGMPPGCRFCRAEVSDTG